MPLFSGVNSQNSMLSYLLLKQFDNSEHNPHTNKLLYSKRHECCLSLVTSASSSILDVVKVTTEILQELVHNKCGIN